MDAVGGGAEEGDEVGVEGAADRGDFLDGFDDGGDEAGVVERRVPPGVSGVASVTVTRLGKSFCTSWAMKPRVVPCDG